jgi:hypothetical protein
MAERMVPKPPASTVSKPAPVRTIYDSHNGVWIERLIRPVAARSRPIAVGLVIGGLLLLGACGDTTEDAGPGAVADTIDGSTPEAPTGPAAPGATPATAAPTPGPAPPPPGPTTTTPPTTAPAPVSVVEELTVFGGRGVESGGGLLTQMAWNVDTDLPIAQTTTFHGPLAVDERAEAKGQVYSQFQPRSSEATVTWNLTWRGTLEAVAGADAAAEGRVTVRVYEVIPAGSATTIGPTVFEQTLDEDVISAALQGVSTVDIRGSDHQSVALPPLDLDKHYRLEAEVLCSTRVVFSLGTTQCNFIDILGGVIVESWSIRFDNVPAD